MTYKRNPESARRYVEGRGEEFKRDIFDNTMTQRQVGDKHGIDQSLISQLRIALIPLEQRRTNRHKVTPEMIAAFKTTATNEELAKRFDIPYPTMERMRRRYVGLRMTQQIRLTETVMTLLRSKFSDRRVAVALGVHSSTVWQLRIKLGIRTPKTKTIITDEQREILAESKSKVEAARRLGLPVDCIKRWHFLVQEGLL